MQRLEHLVAEDIREHTQAQVSAMTSLVDQIKFAFVGFMDKANDQSNTLRQVVSEMQVLSSRLSFIEGTRDTIISIKEKLEGNLKILESQQDATSEMKELIKSLEQTISNFTIP